MKRILITLILTTAILYGHAQVHINIVNGRVLMNRELTPPAENQFTKEIDTLDKNLKTNPNDTLSLFKRALFLLRFNDAVAKPYQREKGALENLVVAKNLADKATDLKMKDFRLKLVRAEIYSELTYRYTGDESWQFSKTQIVSRKAQFNLYKEKANQLYDQLAVIDPQNAYDYKKLKLNWDYPL